MIQHADETGYTELLDGVQLKSMVHGSATHLTEVRFVKGAVVPEHQHPHEQTGYLISGSLRFFGAGGEWAGQFAAMNQQLSFTTRHPRTTHHPAHYPLSAWSNVVHLVRGSSEISRMKPPMSHIRVSSKTRNFRAFM